MNFRVEGVATPETLALTNMPDEEVRGSHKS